MFGWGVSGTEAVSARGRVSAYVWLGWVTDGKPRPGWPPNGCPFDAMCRHLLQTSHVESAHVRRTLLTVVEPGGDTSRASLYFSCQCAGLDGNPVAICAVSRRMELEARPAFSSSAKRRKSQQRWSAKPIPDGARMHLFSRFRRQLDIYIKAVTVGLCRQQLKAGLKLLQVAKLIFQQSPSPRRRRSVLFSMTIVSDRLHCAYE